MSNQVKTLVPKLRFPEFQDAKEWKLSKFSEVYNLRTTNSYSRDMLNYENGSVKNIHYGDIHTKFQTLFDITKETVPFINPSELLEKIKAESYCVEGDMVFADASEDLADVGKSIEITNLNSEPLLSGLHTLLARQIDNKLVIGFGGYLFKSGGIRKQIQKESQGAKVLGISGGRLSGIKIYYPSDKAEQQKIADCLSSLDDLITAQNQKVEALKQHKKGLMQQLFPTEGETGPKLRFSEFQDDTDWALEEFSKYIVLYRGSSPRPIQNYLTSNSNGVNWIKIGDTKNAKNSVLSEVEERITPEGAKHSRKVTIGELILANSMSYGKTYEVAIEGCIYDGWFVLREYENHFDKQFLLQLLNSEYMQNQYQKLSAGGIVQNISSDIVYKTILPCTSLNEQQKIADFLSSIDELISTQTQQLEAYKAHKKGLMQQLFPALEEMA